MHYLDNAATTPVLPQVAQVVAETLPNYYNPSSLYAQGMQAQQVLENARKSLAKVLGCAPGAVYFTGSGTEGCNIAILGAARARREWGGHLVATGYEHPAVIKPLELLAVQEGFSLTLVPPGADGTVDIQEIVNEVKKDTVLVCAMHMNNETGAVLDVQKLAEAVKQKNNRTAVHIDGVQAFTKQPIALEKTAIDTYAVSGHKIHAPKGVGALYVRKGFHLLPPFVGGGQENGLRPGTENVPYIAALAKAAQMAKAAEHQTHQKVGQLYAMLLKGLQSLPEAVLNSPANGYKGIVNFSLPGIRSEVMLHFLEEQDVLVSSGSACGKGSPSHTLQSMRLAQNRVDSALRVSFSGQNTPEDVTALLQGLAAGLQTLARTR